MLQAFACHLLIDVLLSKDNDDLYRIFREEPRVCDQARRYGSRWWFQWFCRKGESHNHAFWCQVAD